MTTPGLALTRDDILKLSEDKTSVTASTTVAKKAVSSVLPPHVETSVLAGKPQKKNCCWRCEY